MSSPPARRRPLLSRVPADFVRAVLKGHSALGLVFAAAIYLVCLTGSIAVFAHEFQRWEGAGTPRMESIEPDAVQRALEAAIARAGPGVEHAYIHLPSEDLPQTTVAVEAKGATTTWIADAEGLLVARGEVPWTNFITRLHINLHLPQAWGVFLVGLTGVALLSSLISGLLAHPRIFRDAFHLRLGGSRRLQEADLHNRLGVWALPFHVIVSLTGALLGLTTLIVGVLGMALFQGDANKVYGLFIAQPPKDDPRPAPVVDIRPMYEDVLRRSPGGRVDLIMFEHPTEMGGAALFNVESDTGRLANTDAYAFDRSGKAYHAQKAADNNMGEAILASLGKLHFGWFGGGLIKVAYGLLGLGLTYLAASGVTIWLARRRDKRNPAPGLERLWSATLCGQPAALALTALAAVALGNGVAVGLLVAIWGMATLLGLATAARLDADAIAHWLKRIGGGALIICAATHMALRPSQDPVAWAVDVVLLAIGAGLFWLARAARPIRCD